MDEGLGEGENPALIAPNLNLRCGKLPSNKLYILASQSTLLKLDLGGI